MTRLPTTRLLPVLAAALLAACTGAGPSGPSLTMPTTATHAAMFPIAPGDVHGPAPGAAVVDCDACHKDKVTGLPSQSFTTFTCTGCHVLAPVLMHDDLAALTTFHQASAAVAALSAKIGQPFDTQDRSCRACHPNGIRDAVDHALHYPLPHGDKAGLPVARCADCHVGRATGNYRVFGCAACHPHDDAATATGHAAVVDFKGVTAGSTQAEKDAAGLACVRCHGDGVLPVKVADHAAGAQGFALGGGAVHAGASTSCFACHPKLRADANKPMAADFKQVSCVSCHDALVHRTLRHGVRADLEPFHLLITDPTTTPPAPIVKAQLFTSVVDAAVAAAGGNADQGLTAACLQCHPQGMGAHPYYPLPHQNVAKTVVASCQQCHVNQARRSDLGCAACHATSSPVAAKHALVPDLVAADLSLAGSAACVRCHARDVVPVRVATTHAGFPIAAGKHSGAAGGVCLSCHPALLPEPTPWAADWKQTNCVGCHLPVASGRAQHDDWTSLRPIHAGVTDFPAAQPTAAAFAAACLKCHPSGASGPPADHGAFFDLGSGGKHAYPGPRIAACLDCHTSANRTNPADFRCAACHAADATPLATGHAAVPDFAADPANPVKCLACHANGVRPATTAGVTVSVAGHGVAAGGFTVGSGAHAGVNGGKCLACHPASRAPTTAAPHWDYARDFRQVTCVGCHVTVGGGPTLHDDQAGLATLHGSVTTFASTVAAKGLSAACLYCHADGAGGAPANHPQLFPIATGTKHAGIACNACHTNPSNRKDLAAFACASCHAATSTNGKTLAAAHAIAGYGITTYLAATTAGGTTTTVAVAMTDGRTCLRCHADSQVDRVASHPGGDSAFGTGSHRLAGCLTCHSRYRTDKPWGALFTEAQGSAGPPPSGCYVCHPSGSG